jgi:hypothetical protein
MARSSERVSILALVQVPPQVLRTDRLRVDGCTRRQKQEDDQYCRGAKGLSTTYTWVMLSNLYRPEPPITPTRTGFCWEVSVVMVDRLRIDGRVCLKSLLNMQIFSSAQLVQAQSIPTFRGSMHCE